jgi:DNA-binding ferritin-like protein
MEINDGLERVNIRMPIEAKDWFKKEAKKYGTTMSVMIAFVLVNYKEQRDSARAVADLAKQSEGTTTNEILKGIKELTERFSGVVDMGQV